MPCRSHCRTHGISPCRSPLSLEFPRACPHLLSANDLPSGKNRANHLPGAEDEGSADSEPRYRGIGSPGLGNGGSPGGGPGSGCGGRSGPGNGSVGSGSGGPPGSPSHDRRSRSVTDHSPRENAVRPAWINERRHPLPAWSRAAVCASDHLRQPAPQEKKWSDRNRPAPPGQQVAQG